MSSVLALGCSASLGTLPVLSMQSPTAFKLIRARSTAERCRVLPIWGRGDTSGPLDQALESIRSLDPEIDQLRNIQVTESRVGLWPICWWCVSVTADAGRNVPTVVVPMAHEHHAD